MVIDARQALAAIACDRWMLQASREGAEALLGVSSARLCAIEQQVWNA
jgi:hypothetical protein